MAACSCEDLSFFQQVPWRCTAFRTVFVYRAARSATVDHGRALNQQLSLSPPRSTSAYKSAVPGGGNHEWPGQHRVWWHRVFPHSTIQVVPHALTPRCAPHIARNMTHVSVFPLLFPRAPWVMVRAPFSPYQVLISHGSSPLWLSLSSQYPGPIYATNICTPCFCPPHCPLLLAYLAQIATSSCHMLRLHHVPRPVLLTPVSWISYWTTIHCPSNPATGHMLYIFPSVAVSGILLTEPGPNMTLSVSSHWFELWGHRTCISQCCLDPHFYSTSNCSPVHFPLSRHGVPVVWPLPVSRCLAAATQ